MTIKFNGRDLVTRFKEDPDNQAIRQYRIEYACKSSTVVHYIKAEDNQGNDQDGNRLYRDVLTYAENEAAGLTRTPTVSLFSQNADMAWSAGLQIDAQNPEAVFDDAPRIVSTLTGVEVTVQQPVDSDYEGIVAWVHTDSNVPLDAAHERYRGKAGTFSLQLPDDDTYYLRIAPYDAFGLSLFSAWDAQPIKRGDLNAAVGATPVFQGFDQTQKEIEKQVDAAQSDARDAKQQIADARTSLDKAVTDAKTAADAAKADAASVRTDLIPQVDAAKAAAKKASEDLDTEIARAKGEEGTITKTVTTAQKRANDAYTAVTTETTQRQNADTLLTQRIDTVESTQKTDKGTLDSRITQEVATLVKADETISKRVDEVVSQATTDRGNFNAAISDEQTTRASETDALSKRVDSVVSQATTDRGDFNAAISGEATARAAVDQALSDKTDVVEAKLRGDQESGLSSQIKDQATASVDRDSANANRSSALETRMTTQEGYANAINAKADTNETASVNRDNAIAGRTASLEAGFGGLSQLSVNGNFDNDVAGWTGFTAGMVVPSSYGRTNVVRTGPSTKYNGITGSKVYVTSNDQRFKLKVSWRCAAATAVYYFGVVFYDADNNIVPVSDGTGNYPLGPNIQCDSVLNNGWNDREVIVGKSVTAASPYGGTTTIPAGCVYMRPIMFLNYTDVPGSVTEVDYFTVEDVTDSQKTLARLITEETVRADQNSSIVTRTNALESSVNTGPNNLNSLRGALNDEITSRAQNDGVIIDRVVKMEATARNVATAYTAVSRGNGAPAKFSKGSGLYNLDGANFTGGGRGYRVSVFDASNTMIASNVYDTLGGLYSGGAGNMAGFLNGITEGQAVIITTDDEPQGNRLTGGLVEAMERCGAGPLFSSPKFAYRGAYILIGQAGIGKGNGNEYYSGSVDNGADAWLEARFDLLVGKPQLNGAGKAIAEANAAIKDEQAARATAVDAVASRTQAIETSYTAGGNLLSNTDFAYDMTGWNYGQEAATGAGRDSITGNNWWPAGLHCLVMGQENTNGNRAGYFVQDVWGIEAGKNYQATVYGASHRCQLSIYIDCYDAVGNFLGTTQSTLTDYAGNDNYAPLTSWWRHKLDFVTPVNTSRLRYHLMKYGTTSGGNSYAFFVRPQLVQTRPGVTAAVPYVPGSGDQANLASNSRISEEATIRSNADVSQSNRISTTEAQLAGSHGSGLSSRISDVDTASVTRYNSNANRATTLEAAALVGGSSAKNDKFAMWRDGAQHPDVWALWNAEGNYRTERVAGNGGSPYAVRTLNDVANTESGFFQTVPVYAGKWVVEVTAESDGSGFSGAGMTLHGVFNIDFLADPDTKGLVGDQINTMRTWTKAFDFDQNFINNIGGVVNFHAMVGWTGFGRYRAPKYMKWHRMALRPAGFGDSEAFRANARITDLATTSASATTAVANRTSVIETNLGRGGFLNRNAMFNEPWDGNQYPPGWGGWSQEGGGYYGKWPDGGGLYGQYAFQWDRQGTNSGFWQQINGSFPSGYYVLDCEVRLEDGNTAGAGFHANFMNGYADQVNFFSEQDVNEQTGQRGNGNYKFTKLIYNGANSTQINLHPMPGWNTLSGYNGFLRTIWFKAGIRPATLAEIKSGKVENLSARVSTTESAISNLNGKAAAYWQVQAVAGNNRAQMRVWADANGGGGVDFVGDVTFKGNLDVGADGGGNRVKITNNGVFVYDGNGTRRVALGLNF